MKDRTRRIMFAAVMYKKPENRVRRLTALGVLVDDRSHVQVLNALDRELRREVWRHGVHRRRRWARWDWLLVALRLRVIPNRTRYEAALSAIVGERALAEDAGVDLYRRRAA